MVRVKFKPLILAMVLTLLITFIPSNSFAEDNLDKRIKEVKALFDIGDDYEYFDKYQDDIYGGKKTTSLSWRFGNTNISVGIDEEGNILNYSKNTYRTGRISEVYKFPKISKEQGEKTAREFIKKLYPDILDKIKLRDQTELYGSYLTGNLEDYWYSFVEERNGIEFDGSNVHVTVDTQTGEVTNFNINWERDLKFPNVEGIISKEEAKKKYVNNIDLELLYKTKEIDKDTKSYLGYNIVDTDKTVDAKTGDLLSTLYKNIHSVYNSKLYQDMENISFEEENKLVSSKKIISGKEAGKKIVDTFKLGEEYEVERQKLQGNKENDIYVWDIMVMKRVGNSGTGTGSKVNAITGEIIDFSDPGSRYDDSQEAKYSKDELLKKAEGLVKKNNPEKYKEVEYIEEPDEGSRYGRNNESYFPFIRKANNLRVQNDGFAVVLSNVTGEVSSYNYNWSDLEFESPDKVIDKDAAKEVLFKDKELELEYQIKDNEQDKKNVDLVYDFKEKYLAVDAKEAEIVDNNKEQMEKFMIKDYKDIEKSFAKKQIEKLQEFIFLFEGDEFKPKQEISQIELFRLLGQTKGMFLHDDESYIYERFIGEGLITKEEINKEAKVTREEAIKYIIRAFGQEPMDNIGDIYKLEYKDADKVSSELRGHLAIAKGLGIVNGEGNFRPKDNLTREEAAVLIYNILNRS